ncbi:hypothetical protein EON81_08955 [bacterium]|nr:MAG: hypothetical protein EON81_08955 [bacterium]
MPNVFGAFRDPSAGRAAFDELLSRGVSEDDLSLVSRRLADSEGFGASGDGSFIVGRSDDPEPMAHGVHAVADMQTIQEGDIGGIDTSDIGTDVDSIDQADDSQELANRMIYPYRETSQGEHEYDDLALAADTGFPTTPPEMDDFQADFPGDETVESLPALGHTVGGGPLATAAMAEDEAAIETYFKDENVHRDPLATFLEVYREGGALVGVSVSPEGFSEGQIRQVLENNGGEAVDLYDAHRFHNAEADASTGER